MILRSVHSAVNHTPTHLLKEIILVDDNSDEGMGAASLCAIFLKRCKDTTHNVNEGMCPYFIPS